MFKIVNRYGKSVTITMSMEEKTLFASEVLANIVCKFLNAKETKPDWLTSTSTPTWTRLPSCLGTSSRARWPASSATCATPTAPPLSAIPAAL